jgi:hypothetical protein
MFILSSLRGVMGLLRAIVVGAVRRECAAHTITEALDRTRDRGQPKAPEKTDKTNNSFTSRDNVRKAGAILSTVLVN